MAGSATNSSAADALDYYTGRAVKNSSPFTTYVALLTAAPSPGATLAQLAEVDTAGYARQEVEWTAATDAVPSSSENDNLLTFGPMTEDMTDEATHAALVTVQVGTEGEVRHVWQLDSSQQAVNGQALQMGQGKLVLTMG